MTRRAPYPTDLSDERWGLIGPMLENWRAARHHRALDTAYARFPRLRTLWADSAFRTTCIEHAARLGIAIEVVQRAPGSRGFVPLPRRWTIERTFGWLMMFRRLARDYETLPARSAALIQLRMIDLMARRLTGESTPTWRGT
ncbi:transposase [Streptomyces sp. NPDC057694]|uniref:transposase n=1 Tax=Streptomyces sp. NPDC057694 TaxID=3346216 RepID=UPI0036933325